MFAPGDLRRRVGFPVQFRGVGACALHPSTWIETSMNARNPRARRHRRRVGPGCRGAAETDSSPIVVVLPWGDAGKFRLNPALTLTQALRWLWDNNNSCIQRLRGPAQVDYDTKIGSVRVQTVLRSPRYHSYYEEAKESESKIYAESKRLPAQSRPTTRNNYSAGDAPL
ncbi:hypothetical protein B0H19DRAFT_1066229 [Mycena capillaripes]|nr:hypothetical protein B0H19DRAFT_1066229 [Mycena capillaripes]